MFKWSRKATVQSKWKIKVFHTRFCGKLYSKSPNTVFGDRPPKGFFPCYECSRNYYSKNMWVAMGLT